MTWLRKTAKTLLEIKGIGQRNTASTSHSSGAKDPRWRRVQQESNIRPIVGGALKFDDSGKLMNSKLAKQAELAGSASLLEVISALNALNRELREKGYQ